MRESKVLEALCERKTVSIGGVLVRMVEGEIKPGDRYVAERNTGPQLLTAKRIVGQGEGPGGFGNWIDPEESAYNYDIWECVKVRMATPNEEMEYREQEDIRLARDELAKGVSEEAVADLLYGAGGYDTRQAMDIVRMAKESLAGS